jgi:hypothetical protein
MLARKKDYKDKGVGHEERNGRRKLQYCKTSKKKKK